MIQLSLYLVACLVLGLGLLVWHARPESPTNRSFGAFGLLSAIWVFGVAFFHSGTDLSFWAPLAFAATGVLPATFLTFVRHYPTPAKWPAKWILRLNFSIGLMFATLSLTTRLIVRDATLTPTGPARETGPLYWASLPALRGIFSRCLVHGSRRVHLEMDARTGFCAYPTPIPRFGVRGRRLRRDY